MTLSSSPTAGDAQYAVGATGNSQRESQAQTNQKPCTTPCSANGTHSDGYTGAFEGPEKLLEMWFAPHADAYCIGQGAVVGGDEWSASRSGLRRVPLGEWRDMLDLVHCQVLSTLSNQYVDSYLLSESSFFVYPHKLVLKTCGTTTLLYAIPRILDIASRYVGARGVFQLFYSRKNFMYPMEQDELHRSWGREVEYLDALFPEGAAYLIGKTNRDHWHVYLSAPHGPAAMGDATAGSSLVSSPTLNPAMSRSSSQSTVHGLPLAPDACSARSDTTVEILMTGLDPERMRVMYLGGASSEEGSVGGKLVERASGIADIYPDAKSDSFLFTPCGFSLNGLEGDGYYTIHVTPEPHCSYASFETNTGDLRDPREIKRLVEKVTRVFGPRCVTVTVFKARPPLGDVQLAGGIDGLAKDGLTKDGLVDAAPLSFAPVDGYRSVDRVLYEFDHYWLRYAYYIMTE